MPGPDDRLKGALERMAAPADPSGAFERIVEKKTRRRIMRRVEVGGLALIVLGGTVGGTFALAHVSNGPTTPTAIGVFRDHSRPVYGELMEQQIAAATDKLGQGDLAKLLHSGDTWTVG